MNIPILALLAAAGCTTEPIPLSSDLVEVDPGGIMETQVVPTTGQGVLSVPIRLNNAYGLPIPGGTPPTITVNGVGATVLSDDFSPDTFGITTVDIAAAPNSVVQVVADGSSGLVWSVASEPPEVLSITGSVYPNGAPLPSFAADGTNGNAFSGNNEIWWQPNTQGSEAWRTASFPGTIAGMWSTQVDSDGILDLAAWTEQQVFLMRGWPGGGYAWGSAWDVPEGRIVGISPTDVNGDRLVDLVIGVDYGQEAQVELLLGDGAWGFEAIEPLALTFGISTITAADEDLDGRPDISMIRSADGTVRRYSFLEEGWTGGTPAQISVGNDSTMLGGTLRPMADLNGDGDLELIVEGPKGASSQRLVFFSFNGNTIIKYEQAYANYYVDIADMEGNGTAEVLAVEDGTLHLTRFDADGGSFVAQNHTVLSEAGPMAIADIDGDSLLDMVMFADVPTYFPGSLSEGGNSAPGDAECTDNRDNDQDGTIDDGDTQCSVWRPASYTWRSFGLDLIGQYEIIDLNDDGMDDLIGYVAGGGENLLQSWVSSIGKDGLPELIPGDGYTLYNDGTPLDLAVCGSLIYTLYETSAKSLILARVDIDNGTDLSQGRASNEVTGSMLACGTIDDEDVVVVSTNSGEWVSYEQDRLEAVGSGFVEAVRDIAVANNGVVGCGEDGCSVAAGDVDGDGIDEVFRSDAAGITVEGWGTTTELAGKGVVGLTDADRDGRVELLVTDIDSQRIVWYPGVNGSMAPPTSWWRDATFGGTAHMADLDGDGIVELVVPTERNSIAHSPTSP